MILFLTLLSFILSPFQIVSSIKCMMILFLTLLSFILSPFQIVSSIKCMMILFLTVFSFILSPFQIVSYIIYMIIVLNFFYLVSFSAGELHRVLDYCLFDCFHSCHLFR